MSKHDRNDDDETTHERPSSFREVLYRDRHLVSRRQMDRRLRDRAAERDVNNGREVTVATYFPALSRFFSGSTSAEVRAVILVIILVLGAFVFGRWVGQQGGAEAVPQSAPIVSAI